MSTSAITSSLLSQILGSPSTENQFASDLNQLAQDLQSGDLSAAQQDYVTLSEDAVDGATSSTANTSASGITTSLLSNIASSSSDSSSFVNELNQLGSDLENGDLTSAQQDLLQLDSTAANAGSATSAGSTFTSSSALASPNDNVALIQTIVRAMEAGDDSLVSSALSQLASKSSSSAGASALQAASESFASGSSSSSSSSQVSQLLQSLNTSSSGNSASILSLLT